MEKQTTVHRRYWVEVAAFALVLLGLYLSSLHSYLLFHSIAELFSIVVAFGIFVVTWNSRRFLDNSYFLFIGIAFLFIGSMDLVHTMAYKGMGIFPGYDSNLATQLWIAARYMNSISFLVAPLFLGRRPRVSYLLLGYAIVTSLLLTSIFPWNNFPVCFIDGVGLTPFKQISEYIISTILLGALLLLFKKRTELDKRVLQLLAGAIILTIGSELAFTLYTDVYGIYNLIGHFFKIIAYYLFYKAIIETGLMKPYDLLFRSLKQSQEQLASSNLGLEREISQRKQMEEALKDALGKARERQMEIAALLKSSRAVLRHSDFSTAARSIFNYSKEYIGATAGYVALLSEDGTENEVLFLDSGSLPCAVDPSLPMPIRGLRGEAYRTGKAVYQNNFSESEWTKFMPPGHVSLKNVLFAPMVIEGKVAGLLGLANKPGGFTERDAHAATAFGELAAIALRNSRTWESLQHSEERFRSVTQTAEDAIIASDSFGNIILWNRGAETFFGYTVSEATGKPVAILMPERLRKAHETAMRLAVSRGELKIAGKTIESVGLRRDGSEFPMELSLATWQAGGETFFAAVIRDITERKGMQEQLIAYERLASLGKLAGSISHELRNPLAAIDTSVFYLQTSKLKDADEKVQTHLKRIHANVMRSAAILQALQDFTQSRELFLTKLDLREVTTEALISSKMPATVEILRHFPEREVMVKGDSQQLQKAFTNIIDNAIQAMEEKGTLTVEIGVDTGNTWVAFADTGPGIPSENLNKIFEPLFSTRAWGIGFGLPIAKMIIEKHGGKIEARSEMGKGATFVVRLPLHQSG